jgi:hypothetical protein
VRVRNFAVPFLGSTAKYEGQSAGRRSAILAADSLGRLIVTTLTLVPDLQPQVEASGLAPVICYDPYYQRMVRYLRHILADGHPAMIRLHPGIQYPASDSHLHSNDLEGHAVLIVGYDDERQEFTLADPWDRRWGGVKSGLRTMSYNELSMVIMDSSKDITQVLCPLEVTVAERDEDGQRMLDVTSGFYAPKAIVMDRDNQVVEAVHIRVTGADFEAEQTIKGAWYVGEKATLAFTLPEGAPSSLKIEASATIAGLRPYAYRDTVSTTTWADIEVRTQRIAATA